MLDHYGFPAQHHPGYASAWYTPSYQAQPGDMTRADLENFTSAIYAGGRADMEGLPSNVWTAPKTRPLNNLPAGITSNFVLPTGGNSLIAYSAASNTTIFYSSNGGDSWEPAPPTSAKEKAPLVADGFGNVLICFGSGSFSTDYIYSTDYGKTNINNSFAASIFQYARCFVGKNRVLIAGYNSDTVIWANSVAGPWTSVAVGVTRNWRSMVGFESGLVLLMGDTTTTLAYSLDFGLTWATTTLPFTANTSSMMTICNGRAYLREAAASNDRMWVVEGWPMEPTFHQCAFQGNPVLSTLHPMWHWRGIYITLEYSTQTWWGSHDGYSFQKLPWKFGKTGDQVQVISYLPSGLLVQNVTQSTYIIVE